MYDLYSSLTNKHFTLHISHFLSAFMIAVGDKSSLVLKGALCNFFAVNKKKPNRVLDARNK